MNKCRFFIILLFGLCLLPSMAQTQIGLGVGIVDPTQGNGNHPRTPIKPVYITQDDYEITLPTLGCDITLQLLDEGGEVAYETFVPAGTTTVVLPSTLSGDYELRLVTSTFYFYGYITL